MVPPKKKKKKKKNKKKKWNEKQKYTTLSQQFRNPIEKITQRGKVGTLNTWWG